MGDSLESILALLTAQKKIDKLFLPADPKRKIYDPSKKCAYHSGSPGHDTQDYWSLKHKIQNLIDSGDTVVKQPNQPNITTNPLPMHNGSGVNMIESYENEFWILKYLRRIDDSVEIVAMVSSIHEVKGEPIMARGMTDVKK